MVRGHSHGEAAIAWATERYAELERELPLTGFVIRDQWARWTWEAGEDGPCRCLRLYWHPERGRFPVTVAYDGDEWAREEREKAEERGQIWRMTAAVLEKWPDATRIEVSRRYHPDLAYVAVWSASFRLPELIYPVDWYGDPDRMWVSAVDVGRYNARKEKRS